MAIIYTQDDKQINEYKEGFSTRKVIYHIKDIFKEHWNNFGSCTKVAVLCPLISTNQTTL